MVVGWVEAKWYTGKAHLYLNVPKFDELVRLAEISKAPSFLVFREGDRWGYVRVHDGEKIVCEYIVKLAGGTPKGRVKNDDDIEPLVVISRKSITWGKC